MAYQSLTPRFAYRRAMRGLDDAPEIVDVRPAIETLCQELASLKGDYLKFKFYLPDFLDKKLNPKERMLVKETLTKVRGKVRNRLKFVFPHCADEFSLSIPFLMEVLSQSRVGGLKKKDKCFAIGSCFARNIGNYLSDKGFNVDVLPQSEDLNSPFSNAAFLELCAVEPEFREEFIHEWLNLLYPDEPSQCAQVTQNIFQAMEPYKNMIAAADVVILTLGNNLDFFGPEPPFANKIKHHPLHSYAVAPKLLGFVSSEEVEERANFAKVLKKRGFGLRAGTFLETEDAVTSMLRAVRQINESCKIFMTVSPVPIDSAVGLSDGYEHSAIQLDCQSKSQLRSIVEEVKRDEVTSFTYFPSYEVVRWIAPMVSAPTFGFEDASSRHVSSEILQAIFDLFFECHCEE